MITVFKAMIRSESAFFLRGRREVSITSEGMPDKSPYESK
jgi:hypothetical protein